MSEDTHGWTPDPKPLPEPTYLTGRAARRKAAQESRSARRRLARRAAREERAVASVWNAALRRKEMEQ